MSTAPRLRLGLRPSPGFAALIVLAHAAAGAAALAVLGTGWAGGGVAGLLGALGLATAWRVALLRAPASAVSLEVFPDGGWTALRRDGGTRSGREARRRVTAWWVVVPAAAGGLLVVAGMAAPEDFRRLRAWALWSGGN